MLLRHIHGHKTGMNEKSHSVRGINKMSPSELLPCVCFRGWKVIWGFQNWKPILVTNLFFKKKGLGNGNVSSVLRRTVSALRLAVWAIPGKPIDDFAHSVCACGVRMVILADVLTHSWLVFLHAILWKHINLLCLWGHICGKGWKSVISSTGGLGEPEPSTGGFRGFRPVCLRPPAHTLNPTATNREDRTPDRRPRVRFRTERCCESVWISEGQSRAGEGREDWRLRTVYVF